MTTDHRAEAEQMLADAYDYAARIPSEVETANSTAAWAIPHALLAIHDLLDARLPDDDEPLDADGWRAYAAYATARAEGGSVTQAARAMQPASPETGRAATESDDENRSGTHGGVGSGSASEAQDEALAKVIFETHDEFDQWENLSEFGEQCWIDVARAAREHLNPDDVDWEATTSLLVQQRDEQHDRARSWRLAAEDAERDRIKAEAEVERLTRERDEARLCVAEMERIRVQNNRDRTDADGNALVTVRKDDLALGVNGLLFEYRTEANAALNRLRRALDERGEGGE